MTNDQKVSMIQTMMGEDAPSAETIGVYLDYAAESILSTIYSIVSKPDSITDIPDKYVPTQIQAVINGLTLKGAEGESAHAENGVSISYKFSTIDQYVRTNVLPKAGFCG